MNWLVLIFAFLPFCFGVHEVTEEICANIGNSYPINFTSLVNGSTLNVCSQYLQDELQCCSQSDEDALGMTLNTAVAVSLGSELRALQDSYGDLITALSNVQLSLINDVLRPLMNYSVDRTNAILSFDSLDMIREEVLDNINSTIQGTMSANLTEEMIRYFIEGISAYYVNLAFYTGTGGTIVITPTQRTCANIAIYEHLFPSVEQAKIASLGNNLQQIAVAYEVARAVLSSTMVILEELQNFDVTSTCTNVWTQQYACPLCAGQDTPLCEGRCNEVMIGCTSSMQQVIVQLNVLLDFTRASVNSLVNGDPYDDININNVGDLYFSAFETSLQNTHLFYEIINDPGGANCGIGSKKRSVDSRHKRQANVMFPNVTIDQSIVMMINDQLLPTVMNVSLDSDRIAICNSVMANGPDTNCTLGVDSVSPYMSTFDRLEISDQEDNPAGTFNLAQLREQARPQTYAVTDLLTNRSDIMMLYENVLPGRDIPNLDFLTAPTPTISMSVTPTAGDMPGPTQSDGTSTVSLSSFITETTATPSTAIAPSSTVVMTRPTETGGATAVSFSMFVTLAALLFTSVFVD